MDTVHTYKSILLYKRLFKELITQSNGIIHSDAMRSLDHTQRM